MGKLIYSAIGSLDGYVADREGKFEWAAPGEDVHQAVSDLLRPVGTSLLGRRMYEVLLAWETMKTDGEPTVVRNFAEIWRATDKVVYSHRLEKSSSARTRIERIFAPEVIRRMKAASERDISIGGPELAGQALRAGLVDACHLFLHPIIVGGGTRVLPDDLRVVLDLVDVRRFSGGVVYLHYRMRSA